MANTILETLDTLDESLNKISEVLIHAPTAMSEPEEGQLELDLIDAEAGESEGLEGFRMMLESDGAINPDLVSSIVEGFSRAEHEETEEIYPYVALAVRPLLEEFNEDMYAGEDAVLVNADDEEIAEQCALYLKSMADMILRSMR